LALIAFLALFSFDARAEAAPPEVAAACSRISPSMQSAVLEAIVYGGGPLSVEVAGWMCGRTRTGTFVRVVMLRYPTRDAQGRSTGGGEIVPVVFEDGVLVAHGWHLFESQPNRYGVDLPTRAEPWRTPTGWIVVESEYELAAR
jgi:hypothetical protein